MSKPRNSEQSGWRFLILALNMRSPEQPAFRHVLITLASHAGPKGTCYPGYKRLMEETGYGSKQTISDALQYWKDKGVITWKKGWGNAHKRVLMGDNQNSRATTIRIPDQRQ